MIELTEIINNPINRNDRQLLNIAALLSSDDAFAYTTTYITDSEKELRKFHKNTIELNKLMIRSTKTLNDKLLSIFEDKGLVWAYKLKANNSLEVLSDDISFLVISEKYENHLLKFLTSSSITSFVLSLHFKYSKDELIALRYNDSFDFHIQHSFKVNNERDIKKSIIQFVKIVKLHLYAL